MAGMVYRRDIDGLRALAILSVLVFHGYPERLGGGFTGVDVFFVISGYLISGILLAEAAADRFSFRSFYARRVRRIFPALLLMLAFCLGFGWVDLFPAELAQLGKHIAAGAGFSANLVLWQEAGYFDTASTLKPLLHLWSLGVEEQFYIFWPVAILLVTRRHGGHPRLLAVLVALSFLLCVTLLQDFPTADFYSPFTRLWELGAGGLLAAWQRRASTAATGAGRELLSLAGCVSVLTGFVLISEHQGFPGWLALVPVAGTCAMIAAGPDAWLNRQVLGSRLLVGVGLISYPLYLWHWPVLAFYRITKNDALTDRNVLNALLVSFLLAWLTWRFIERPLRGSRWPYLTRTLSWLMAGLLVAGLAVWMGDGLSQRAITRMANLQQLAEVRPRQPTSEELDSCQRLMRLSPSHAICRTSDPAPRYLIIGDSHGEALYAGVAAGLVKAPVMFLGHQACLPFLNYEVISAGSKMEPNCVMTASEINRLLPSLVSVKTVILSTRGPFYFSGNGFGVEDQHMKIVPLKGALTGEEAFIDGYDDLIASLEVAGKNVVFLIDWPELGVNPEGCIGQRPLLFSGHAKRSNCINSLATVSERQASYRRLILELAKRHPALVVYDTRPFFCNDSECRGIMGGHMLYFDDDHINIFGSKLILDSILEYLQR